MHRFPSHTFRSASDSRSQSSVSLRPDLWLLEIDHSGLTCPCSTWQGDQKDIGSAGESMLWIHSLDDWPTDNSVPVDASWFTFLNSQLSEDSTSPITFSFSCACGHFTSGLVSKDLIFFQPWSSTLGTSLSRFPICAITHSEIICECVFAGGRKKWKRWINCMNDNNDNLNGSSSSNFSISVIGHWQPSINSRGISKRVNLQNNYNRFSIGNLWNSLSCFFFF